MPYLLLLEWLKNRNNNTVRVVMGLYLGLLPFILLMFRSDSDTSSDTPGLLRFNDLVSFPGIFEYLGYSGNWIVFILFGYLGIHLVTQEYSYRTARQNIMDGLSRNEYLLSKLYAVLAVSLVATLWYLIVALIYGFIFTDPLYTSLITRKLDYIPRYFLMCMGYMSFGVLLGFLTRRSGQSILLYLSYILFLEPILRWGIHNNIAPSRAIHFYPLNAIEDLAPPPLASQMINTFQSGAGDDAGSIFLTGTEAMLSSTIYIVLFWVIAFRIFRRRDL